MVCILIPPTTIFVFQLLNTLISNFSALSSGINNEDIVESEMRFLNENFILTMNYSAHIRSKNKLCVF
jgi:hypothetical protein